MTTGLLQTQIPNNVRFKSLFFKTAIFIHNPTEFMNSYLSLPHVEWQTV